MYILTAYKFSFIHWALFAFFFFISLLFSTSAVFANSTIVYGRLANSDGAIGFNNEQVRVLVNGIDFGLVTETANDAARGGLDGEFQLDIGSVFNDDILTFFVDDGSIDAVTVTKSDGNQIADLGIIRDFFNYADRKWCFARS